MYLSVVAQPAISSPRDVEEAKTVISHTAHLDYQFVIVASSDSAFVSISSDDGYFVFHDGVQTARSNHQTASMAQLAGMTAVGSE